MSNHDASTQPAPIIFDGWRSISSALFMALVGYAVMVAVPVLAKATVVMLGFSDEQAGRVWGADLGGMFAGSLLSALLVTRMNRRLLLAAGVALSVGGNALCLAFSDYETVLWLRVLTGVGSGIFTSVAVVTLGGTTNTIRAWRRSDASKAGLL